MFNCRIVFVHAPDGSTTTLLNGNPNFFIGFVSIFSFNSMLIWSCP